MAIQTKTIINLVQLLGAREASNVVHLAKKQEHLEAHWRRIMKQRTEEITRELIANAAKTGRFQSQLVDFEDIVMRHSFEVMKSGIRSTRTATPIRNEYLAAPPPSRIPKSLKELQKLWDQWRTKKKLPPRQKKIAEKLKKNYLSKVESTWKKQNAAFLDGATTSKTEAVQAMAEAADVSYSYAKMTVDTETTYYYNKVRRDIYDQSDDITHYLFIAVRDHATTPWCKTRHGLVYKKGDPLLDKETPPIHWNCRSEILPLSPHNPNHAKIIQLASRQRRNNKCAPLPPGWTGRTA